MLRSVTIRFKAALLASVAIATLTDWLPPVYAAPPKIKPLHITAYLSTNASAAYWNADVVDVKGKRAYTLLFEPEYGPNNEVIGLDLAMVDARTWRRGAESNLLNPHNWHGLQRYEFLGKDLAQGVDKSTFGSHREIRLDGEKLIVQMDVKRAKVTALPNGAYRIDELEVAIAIDNLGTSMK